MSNIETKCDRCYIEFVIEKPVVDTVIRCPKGHLTVITAENRQMPKIWPVKMARLQDQDECSYEDEPRCPYCGLHMNDSWELDLEEDGRVVETDCNNCGNIMRVMANISITYTTSPKDGWPKEKV